MHGLIVLYIKLPSLSFCNLSLQQNYVLDSQLDNCEQTVSNTVQASNSNNMDGLDGDMEHTNLDRRALIKSADEQTQQYPVLSISPSNDSTMEADVEGAWIARQGPGGANAASPFDTQAPERLPRQFNDSLSRSIRQHRKRTAPHRNRVSDHRYGNCFSPRKPVYYDRDDFRADRAWIPSQQKEDSPETLEEKARAVLVANMADADFKEEREDRREDRRDDRRDRGNYRGNNKRRRDGEYTSIPFQATAQAA